MLAFLERTLTHKWFPRFTAHESDIVKDAQNAPTRCLPMLKEATEMLVFLELTFSTPGVRC